MGEMDSFTIIVENFNTLLSIMDGTTRQKISKETEDLNNAINQLDLTEQFYTTTAYSFFSSANGTFSNIIIC